MAESSSALLKKSAGVLVLTVLLPFGIGYYMSYLFRTVNAIISPQLVADVGLTPADLGLMTSAYFFTFAVVQLPLGIILDRYGPRRVQAALLIVAALGACLFAFGTDVIALVIGRGLIGIGVSGALMAALRRMCSGSRGRRYRWSTASSSLSGRLAPCRRPYRWRF